MKTAFLYFQFLLCALIDMVCWLLQLTCSSLGELSYRCSINMEKAKRNLIVRNNAYTMPLKKESDLHSSPLPESTGIVGGSKTTFMKELPILRKPKEEEVKPFKSQPLEFVVEEPDDFEKEPTGFVIESDNRISNDDIDDFIYTDNEEDMNNSSGVSFEELSKTISTLSINEPSGKEKEKAVDVLNAINNTELFQFITINNFVYENAKILMDSLNNAKITEEFNIKDFVE
jgi:hypothetical protein